MLLMFCSRLVVFSQCQAFLSRSLLLCNLNLSPLISSMSTNHQSNLIAVVQMSSKNDKEENLKTSKRLINEAASAGAKVVFLPEAFDFVGENRAETFNLAEPLDGPFLTQLKDTAKHHKVWLSLGGMHIKREGNPLLHNSHLVINDAGELVAAYNKVHLFDVDIPEKGVRLKESDMIEAGEEIVPPVQTPAGRVGLAICYDVRFPEMSLQLRSLGADIITFPSAFTFATGSVHWETLLRARAIETQCYVVAAAQTGMHNKKRSSWGHAMVVDPQGTVVAQCSEGAGYALANINLSSINIFRQTIPVWSHRRSDLYPTPCAKTSLPNDPEPDVYQFGQVLVKASQVFYKTVSSFAFTNKCCVVPGHVLVASLRPVQRLHELSPTEVADLFQTVQKVEDVLGQVHNTSSSTISVQDGPLAGQTIKHVHVHVMPRRPGDFPENDQIYHELEKHDKGDMNQKWRGDDEMAAEATELRSYFLKML